MKKLTEPNGFEGRFSFSFKNEELQWQGQIISKVSEGLTLSGRYTQVPRVRPDECNRDFSPSVLLSHRQLRGFH